VARRAISRAWWAETHGVPAFLYDEADPSTRSSHTT
jgi:hypothetical protein